MNLNVPPSQLSLRTSVATPIELLLYLIDHPTCDHALGKALSKILGHIEVGDSDEVVNLKYDVEDLSSTNRYLYAERDEMSDKIEQFERDDRFRGRKVAQIIDILKTL